MTNIYDLFNFEIKYIEKTKESPFISPKTGLEIFYSFLGFEIDTYIKTSNKKAWDAYWAPEGFYIYTPLLCFEIFCGYVNPITKKIN